MSSDLDQFKGTYIQEAMELLEDMEERLLNLDDGSIDIEGINAIFRCAHSIKGGGGAFGFTRLVGFTHILEYMLDALRTGQMEVSSEIIDALLKSVDVVTALVQAAKNDVEAPEGYETELAETLKRLTDSKGSASPAPKAPEAKPAPVVAVAAAPAPAPAPKKSATANIFEITFRPHRQLFASGNEPLYIIRELQKLGKLDVFPEISRLPDIYDLDTEDCYLSWSIMITTSENEATIRAAFEFVEDECKLTIESLGTVDVEPTAGSEVPSASEPMEDADGAFGLFEMPDPATMQAQAEALKVEQPAVEIKPVAKPAAQAEAANKEGEVTSIRVDINKIDRMVNMVGELVITQAMIMQRLKELPQEYLQDLMQAVGELSRHTRELQESVMAVRMQPVKSVFSRLPRIVRDLSRKLNKQIRLEMRGEATEIDKTVIERLSDPLTHMIRNSLDHGIELPADRVAKGKPEEGVIYLSADNTGGRILIEISDDGNGINRERVLKKAIEKGLVDANANLAPEEIDNLIFHAGFSTAEAVTDVSGRGVGMDVVRRNIKELGGEIHMVNTPGLGSKFLISLPLTLAILDGMITQVGDEKYIIPISNIIETMRLKSSDIQRVKNGSEVISVRGEFIPITYLHRVFRVPGVNVDPDKILVVLVETARQKLGIVVDDLLGQQQVVIKNLEDNSDHVEGVSGATILGDGNVSLILDIAQIQKMGFDKRFINELAA